jgi:hypothetical protein
MKRNVHPERPPQIAARSSGDRPATVESAEEPDSQQRLLSRSKAAGWLCLVLVVLALGGAAASLLGPLGFDLMHYRTSATTQNQLLGSDAAALFVVGPLTLATAVLVARRHPVGPLLALGVGVYALYTYTQIIIGQEYLRLPRRRGRRHGWSEARQSSCCSWPLFLSSANIPYSPLGGIRPR